MSPPLRPHQEGATIATEKCFREGYTRVLNDLCVSAGKSLFYANLARREIERGGRVLAVAPNRELVENIESAALSMGIRCGVNSAALQRRDWRAPMIAASINSVYNCAGSFGQITMLIEDEAHLVPHSQDGMLHTLRRGLGDPRIVGGTGTPFRLLGGSLVDGDEPPYQIIAFHYPIIEGIRDEYLVPPFAVRVDDKLDVTKLRVAQGEYTGASSDVQMIAAMDNHIAQMLHYGRDRRSWLVFEASTKAARAMAERMNQWGIPTGLVLGDRTKAEAAHRRANVEALRSGRLRALVNVQCLTTGFDVQEIDMLVCRRRTKSLSLWIQIVGRLLRTIGGTLRSSIAAGKCDGLLLDFAGNSDEFGPLDFIRPKDTTVRLVSCSSCNKRNAAAAARCWNCDEPMTKRCPGCLEEVEKGVMDCPHCGHDMRTGSGGEPRAPQKLLDTPSGAALISAYRPGVERAGGWLPVRKCYAEAGTTHVMLNDGQTYVVPVALVEMAKDARWIRSEAGQLVSLLVPNGANRSSVRQYDAAGALLVVPMPTVAA